MSVATITIPTPESCRTCLLRYSVCTLPAGLTKNNYSDRHPNCPLKIKPEGLRWIYHDANELSLHYECLECRFETTRITNYCPSCGQKLDPPETTEDVVERLMNKHGKAANERLIKRLEEQRKLDPPEEG